MGDTPAVEITGLVKSYGRTTAVAGLSVRAARGEVTAVLGPNGAGKTTTIEVCEGYRRADAGTVRVLGLDPVKDARQLRDLRNPAYRKALAVERTTCRHGPSDSGCRVRIAPGGSDGGKRTAPASDRL